jgi:hypothetical protein
MGRGMQQYNYVLFVVLLVGRGMQQYSSVFCNSLNEAADNSDYRKSNDNDYRTENVMQ